MRLRISGRSSDLSRIQMQQVSEALLSSEPGIEVVANFRESLGDRMLDDPLWSMPEKGVFTEDFVDDLRSGRTDVVVHSWKDLPTEPRNGTLVAATLPRADVRDVLLVRKDLWSGVPKGSRIAILSSSPRRAHNLAPFLSSALPVTDLEIEFVPIRGNVPTRIRKLLAGEHHGLVVAKAALDRLLGSSAVEMAAMREDVRRALAACHWMILPVSANPTGAAQGALAMEIATGGDPAAAAIVRSLNDARTFGEAVRERAILRSYGGGCHQKIGVTALERPYGTVLSVRGITDAGETLALFTIEAHRRTPRTSRDRMWAGDELESGRGLRQLLDVVQPSPERGLWIARADAVPEDWAIGHERIVWTAGLVTWRRLAARGIWVHGSAEGLGEQEDPRADVIAGRTIEWTKLTHDQASGREGWQLLATYRLSPVAAPRDLSRFTHFYWTSGSQFLRALEANPGLVRAWHACGPGNTLRTIRQQLGSDDRVDVWMTREAWMDDVVEKEAGARLLVAGGS